MEIAMNIRVIGWSTGFANLVTLLTAEIIKWQKCARMGLNGFHMKCIIGTHCNFKNQNPGSPCNKTMFYFLSVIWRFLYEYYNFTNISFDDFLPVFFVTDYFIDFVADFSGQSQY